MMRQELPLVIAHALDEREWQVVAGDWHREGGGRLIGFIEELGGVYEVEIVDQPARRQFFSTFKDAIECFDRFERERNGHGVQAGAA